MSSNEQEFYGYLASQEDRLSNLERQQELNTVASNPTGAAAAATFATSPQIGLTQVRSDLLQQYRQSGTYWLSEPTPIPLVPYIISSTAITATTNPVAWAPLNTDLLITDMTLYFMVNATNDVANYWQFTLLANGLTIASFDTHSPSVLAPNAIYNPAMVLTNTIVLKSYQQMKLKATMVGAPSSITNFIYTVRAQERQS